MKRRPFEAASISCSTCDFCPAVHVNFHRQNGDIFATASVPVEVIEEFIEQIRDCAKQTGTYSPAVVTLQ